MRGIERPSSASRLALATSTVAVPFAFLAFFAALLALLGAAFGMASLRADDPLSGRLATRLVAGLAVAVAVATFWVGDAHHWGNAAVRYGIRPRVFQTPKNSNRRTGHAQLMRAHGELPFSSSRVRRERVSRKAA